MKHTPLLLLALLVLAACSNPSTEDSASTDDSAKERRVTTRHFPVGEGFYQITNVGNFQLEISEGPCSVTAIGDSATIANMRCSVSYGGLTLSTPTEENFDVTPFAMDNSTRVLVTLPELRILANCTGGRVRYNGTLRTPRLHIGGMGSGSIEMDSVVCGHFRYECSRETDARFGIVVCDTAELLTYGTGRTQVGVSANNIVICDLSGQGGMEVQASAPSIYIHGLTAEDATFDVHTDELIAEWQGTGTATLTGTAKSKTLNVSNKGELIDKVSKE